MPARNDGSAAGPPQNGDSVPGERLRSDEWRARVGTARALRFSLLVVPFVGSFVASTAVSRALRPHVWTWTSRIGVFTVSTVVAVFMSMVLARLMRRFLPLAWLCELNLAFPTEAPSRIKVALRAGNSARATEIRQSFVHSGLAADPDVAVAQVLELVASIHRHDRFTRGHCEKTRAVADVIGEQLGLSVVDRNRLRWAAMLHDIGKLAVPAEILNKPGKPTAEEWRTLQAHPEAGASRIEPLRSWLGDWVLAVEQHHERWDGAGYPYGLCSDQISLAGRIVAVADSYEVMTAVRSYKKAMTAQAARDELMRCAGTHFDPQVVRAFLQVGTKRNPVVAGVLSSWVGRLLLGDGPVVSVAQSVGRATSGISGAVSSPLALAIAIPIAGVAVAQTPVQVVAKVAIATTIAFSPLPTTAVATTIANPASPSSTAGRRGSSPAPIRRGQTVRLPVSESSVAVPPDLALRMANTPYPLIPNTVVTPTSVPPPTAPPTSSRVVITVPPTFGVTTTVEAVGGFSFPTTTRGPDATLGLPRVPTTVGGVITTPPTIPTGASTIPATTISARPTPESTSQPRAPSTTLDISTTSVVSNGAQTTTTLIVATSVVPSPAGSTTTAPTVANPPTTVTPTTTALVTTSAPSTSMPLVSGPCAPPPELVEQPATLTIRNRANNRVTQVMVLDDLCNESLALLVPPNTTLSLPVNTRMLLRIRTLKLPALDHPHIEVDMLRPTAGSQTITVH